MAAAGLSYRPKPVIHLLPVAAQPFHPLPMPRRWQRLARVVGLPQLGLHSLLGAARPRHSPRPSSASLLLPPQPLW